MKIIVFILVVPLKLGVNNSTFALPELHAFSVIIIFPDISLELQLRTNTSNVNCFRWIDFLPQEVRQIRLGFSDLSVRIET